MKHLYIFILLFVTHLNFAQDDRLFDNIWHLSYMVQEEESYYPPINSEVQDVVAMFDRDFSLMWSTVLNYIGGNTEFDIDTGYSFSHNNQYITLLLPSLSETQIFENLYFNFFTENQPNNVFTYTISESNEILTLTINSLSNKRAIYSNQSLNNKRFEENSCIIYPNPTKNNLTIKLDNSTSFENSNFEIYDPTGKLILYENLPHNLFTINTEKLHPGLYLIKIKIDGKILFHKFIKT